MTTSAELRRARKAVIVRHLGGVCVGCGEDRLACLTLHHPDPTTRGRPNNGTKAHRSGSLWTRPLDTQTRHEARQCVVLCANCHHLEHADESQRTTAAEYLGASPRHKRLQGAQA